MKASNRLSFNGGGGLDRVAARDRGLVPLRSNQTWFGNGIVTLTPELATSLEYRRLQTETRTGVERDQPPRQPDVRLQLLRTPPWTRAQRGECGSGP